MKRRSVHHRPEHHPDFDRAIRTFFHTRPISEVLARYDAHGLGLGYKVRGNRVLDELALRLFVRDKTPNGKAPKHAEKVDDTMLVPTAQGDELHLQTDVVRSRIAVIHGAGVAEPRSTFDPTDPFEVLVGGVQISTIDRRPTGVGVGRGTLGGWAWDRKGRRVVLISNAHVLGQHDDDATVHITQPSNPATARRIAELAGSAGYFGDEEHTVDAAIGARLDMKGVSMTVHNIGPAIMSTREPETHAPVEKFGVATGHTSGRIVNKYWMGHLQTGAIGGKSSEMKVFRSCMRIQSPRGKWADHGDSGSLVFSRDSLPGSDVKPVIGLHFAGEDRNSRIGFACRMSEVFRALDLTSLAEGALSMALATIPLDDAQEEQARAALGEFLEGVPDSGEPRVLRELITKHRAQLAELVLTDGVSQRRAAGVLRLIVGEGQTVDDICRTVLTAPLVSAIAECCTTFAERGASRELAAALTAVQALAEQNQGHTLADAVAYARTPLDSVGGPAMPNERVTFEDVVAYLDAHGKTDILERFGAVGAEPYRHSDTLQGIELTRENKPGQPTLPPFIEWNRDGRTLAIPLRERRGHVAVRK